MRAPDGYDAVNPRRHPALNIQRFTKEIAMLSKCIPAVVATLGLGLAAMGVSAPAKAGVVVGVGLPGIAVVPPVVAAPYVGVGYGPYWYGGPYYRGFGPYGFAFRGGFRGGYFGHGFASGHGFYGGRGRR
jgi:hypothetical protein